MNRRSVFFSLAVSVVLILLVAEFFTTSKAAFTTPLTITFNYPLAIRQVSPLIQIQASGIQQVYRLGSVAPTGIFAGLNPKAGTSPAGTMLTFTFQNSSTIGANDFVYAIRIKNDSISVGQLQTALIGTCRTITSIGFAKDLTDTLANPSVVNLSAGNNITAAFDARPGQETAIMFYTSPDPPVLADTTVTGGIGLKTIPTTIFQQIYGACPVDLITDIKVGCTEATISDNPATVISGSSVTYKIKIQNTGLVPLANLVITDAATNANLNSQFLVGANPFTGALESGEIAMATIMGAVNASTTKTIKVVGEYLIPDQNGNPSGQTFPLPGLNSILTDSVDVVVVAPPSLTSSFTITPTNFTALPQTLTYTLKATNTGASALATTFDVDAKLKALIASPPAGLVVSPALSFPTASQTIAAGNMGTQQFTITANTLTAWQALADASDPKKSSSKMTINAAIAGAGAAACGAAPFMQMVTASTNFAPPCRLDILKTVACDLGTGTAPPDANFSATATVVKGGNVYYRYKVTNSSLLDTINNITVTDPLAGLPVIIGSLAPGAMSTVDILATVPTTVPANLTITVNGVCDQGNASNTATSGLTIIDPPTLQSTYTITPANFTALPQTLTYTLKATNTSTSPLSTTFDVDAKLKALIAAPPVGLVVSPAITFPTTAQTIAAGGMATQTFTIAANTISAWQALADISDPKKSSSTLTVKASITGAGSTICGVAPITQTVPASTTFTPPCNLEILKTVACDLGAGTPPNGNFSATAVVIKNANVYYRYKVTNPSLLDTITNITVSDPLVGLPVIIGSLAPGAMTTIDVLSVVPTTLPANTTVTVNGTCGQASVSNTTTSTLTIADPSIAASKSVNGSVNLIDYTPGTELVWSLTATNNASTGVPVNLKIDDPLLRGISGAVFKLGSTTVTLPYTANNVPAGSSVTIKASVTFASAADFKAVAGPDQILRNVVTVTGELTTVVCGAVSGALRANAESTVQLITPPNTEVCIIRTCEPNCPPISAANEAGRRAPFSDDKPGSLLLYNLYTSSVSGETSQNTRLSLTNLGTSTTFAHLFFIDGATCNVSDTFACLSPNQTSSFLASEIDPGVTGYVVAIAVNEEGCPISFNNLVGSAQVKFATGHSAVLAAQAVPALYDGVLKNCTSSLAETVIKLDGIDYGLAPATLVADTIFSQADRQSTMLIVNPVGGNLNTADSVNKIGSISGQVFDEAEKGYSFVASINRCQLRDTMSDNFPRITTRLSRVISSGKVGMMWFATTDKAPIAGSIITFNPDVKQNALGFNQGHNLHYSALTNKATYTIPIFKPHI